MKLRMLLLLLGGLLWHSPALLAQTSKVTAGVVAYNQGDFSQAKRDLSAALEKPDLLDAESLTKAYYYRALAKAKASGGPPDALGAHADLIAAGEHADPRWGKKVASALLSLQPVLQQEGLTHLHAAQMRENEGAKTGLLARAARCLEAAASIQEGYQTCDLLGQVYLQKGETEAALTQSQKAIQLYEQAPPDQVDPLIAYTYYRVALIQRQDLQDFSAALSTVKSGQALLAQENQRLKTAGADRQARQQFEKAQKDLDDLSLDLYLQTPELREEALQEFAKAVEDDPDHYLKRVAYAQLLQSDRPAEAAEQYEQAIRIDPEKMMAHFNLGALYLNQAVELFRQANETDDPEQTEQWQKKALEDMKKAKPYFERAYEIDDTDAQVVKALIQISQTLGQEEELQRYLDRQQALGQ